MTPGITPLVAGNWKMNGLQASLATLNAIATGMRSLRIGIDSLICPPATLLRQAADLCAGSPVAIGAQNCHPGHAGAFTGELSADMLADSGARFILVGHSERRTLFGETDSLIRAKAQAVHEAGLVAVICIGETLAEREAGQTLEVLKRQLDQAVPDQSRSTDTVIAYEPVWAIGTGLTPSVMDIQTAHAFMRSELIGRLGESGALMRILYGGSVKASNAAELMGIANVDGALIGGASLKAEDFLAIAGVYATL